MVTFRLTGAVPSALAGEVARRRCRPARRRAVAPTTAAAPDRRSGPGGAAMVEGCEEDLGALGVEVTVEDTHPEQRLCGRGGCGVRGSRGRRASRARRRRCRASGAPPLRTHRRCIDSPLSNKTSSLRAYSGSRLRTIGASTSTCAHDTSPARNASPVASCSRVRRRHAHQLRRARTPRSAPDASTTTAGSTPRRAPNPPGRPTRPPPARSRPGGAPPPRAARPADPTVPHADHSRRSSASSSLTARRICSIGSSPNIRSILPKGYDTYPEQIPVQTPRRRRASRPMPIMRPVARSTIDKRDAAHHAEEGELAGHLRAPRFRPGESEDHEDRRRTRRHRRAGTATRRASSERARGRACAGPRRAPTPSRRSTSSPMIVAPITMLAIAIDRGEHQGDRRVRVIGVVAMRASQYW